MKQAWNKRIKKFCTKVFNEGDLMMVYDASHYNRAHRKLLSKWFGSYQIMQIYKSNSTYTLKNLDECLPSITHK